MGKGPIFNWQEDVLDFLNDIPTNDLAIDKHLICASDSDGNVGFYIFYRERKPDVHWESFSCNSNEAIYNLINGNPTYRYRRQSYGVVKNCTINFSQTEWNPYHYIFTQTGSSKQTGDIRSIKEFTSKNRVLDYLNGSSNLLKPIIDGKDISLASMGNQDRYTVLVPQGLVVVTRPIFENMFNSYVNFKLKHGFKTYIVTAEWIQNH